MTEIKINFKGAVGTASRTGELTTGMVGVPVAFTFDAAWDGLTIVAVFRGSGRIRDRILSDGYTTTVPPEVLAVSNTNLQIGAEGRNSDGTLVIPTTWVTVGAVQLGACASGDPSANPSLPVWAQMQAQIDRLKQQGGGGGAAYGIDNDTLVLKNGVLSVNTADKAEQDNTRPITSAAVHAQLGNIEALLETI